MLEISNFILLVTISGKSKDLTSKEFVCSECGKDFSRKFVLKRHLESKHGKKWVREGEILMHFASFSGKQ